MATSVDSSTYNCRFESGRVHHCLTPTQTLALAGVCGTMIDDMKQVTKRLRRGEDLKVGIERIAHEESIRAGCILSIVGSLTNLHLRLADNSTKQWDQNFEIVSGTGTVCPDDVHIHISVADEEGKVLGGHVKKDCLVDTTAEIVILVFDDVEYRREFDAKTGYKELVIN